MTTNDDDKRNAASGCLIMMTFLVLTPFTVWYVDGWRGLTALGIVLLMLWAYGATRRG